MAFREKIALSTLSAWAMSVLVLLSLANLAVAKQAKPLRIGIDGTYPPYSHRDLDGEYSGYEIELVSALCKAMKTKCELVQYDWENLIAAVRGEKVDFAIGAIGINSKRLEFVTFSQPYLQIPSAVIVRKDSILSGLDVEDLSDAQFGVLKSSPHGEYLRTHLPDTHITLYENEASYFVDLANRKLDGVVGNPILLFNWLQSQDGQICCRMLGTFEHDPQINGEGFGIAIAKNDEKLLKKLNKALDKIHTSGRHSEILRAHLPYLK